MFRETLLAANAIYSDLYGEKHQEEEGVTVLPASFQVLYIRGTHNGISVNI